MRLSAKWSLLALVAGLSLPTLAVAGPVEDARGIVDEGRKFLDEADRAKAPQRGELLSQGLARYSQAYKLLVSRKLQNDAPDLLKEIDAKIASANGLPEVVELRKALLGKVVQAAVDGKMTDCYDHLARLRELDPREWTVEYALGVVSQRMEGG